MIHLKTEIREPVKYTVWERPVTFGSNGIELHGTLFMPSGASRYSRLPGAVMCHGYGGDSEAFENSARTLASEGIVILTFDFRGHGASEGTLDGSIVNDVIDAWDFLRSQPEVDHKSMGLIGHSMGAFSAILAAGKLKKAKVLIALACPGEIKNKVVRNPDHFVHPLLRLIARSIFQYFNFINKIKMRVDWRRFLEFWIRTKPSEALADLEGCAKLFVFCLGDQTSPYNRFLYSYAMASEPKQVMISSGHHTSMIEPGDLRTQWQKWAVGALHGRHPYP
ncbi:MAG: alpha/beta fold hydrolase [Dehalococcoidia bacterium]|nr:alpha/beta fold hydrolase [Dehalococcoidia bacterium]